MLAVSGKIFSRKGWILVYAFDVDEESIARPKNEMAERKLTNIFASVVDNSKRLPLSDRSITLAFMSNVLHGLVANGEAENTFRDIARVIKSNGRLEVVEFKKQESPMGPPLSVRLSPDDVEALARMYGFSRDSVQEVGLTILLDRRQPFPRTTLLPSGWLQPSRM
jgi:ubiquinone/menaquinone biosynthesis C-methylase UbiE